MPYKNKNIANAIILFLKKENISYVDKGKIIDNLKENKYSNEKVSQFPLESFPSIAEKIYRMTGIGSERP